MSEISVKIAALEEAITNLNNLKQTCADMDTTSPETVGGGSTVSELENIAALYKSLNIHFGDLISNTALFMQNVKDSYQASDSKAAQKLSGE